MGGPFVATGAGLDTAITQKAAKTGDTPEPRQKILGQGADAVVHQPVIKTSED